MQTPNAEPARRGAMSRALARLFASPRRTEAKASATASLVSLENLRQPVWSQRDYASFAREGMMQNPVAYRCVRMIAEATASVPLLLYDGDTEVTRHTLLDLLSRPAPGRTKVDLIEGLVGFLLVSGNAYIEAVAIGGEVRELYALRPDRIQISGRVAQAELPIVLDPDAAVAIAESWLFETWAARERASFAVPQSWLALEPGDAITLDAGGRQRVMRVTGVGDHGARSIEARGLDPAVYERAAQPERPTLPPAAKSAGQPDVRFLDLPLLTGDEPDTAGYVVAAQSPWPGPLAIYRSPEAAGFTLQGYVNARGAIGATINALPAGPEGRIDHATRLRVKLASDQTVVSVTTPKMLSGANVAAVQNADGQFEILQYQSAALIAPKTYELSGLLRGQAGTETAMSATALAAGAAFVILGVGLTRLDLATGEVGLPLDWRVGPASRGLGSDMFLSTTHTFQGLGARPLSPVHVRGARTGGDLTISWIRRTRRGGDSWIATEVPMAEDLEAYEIEILSGDVAKRSLGSNSPSIIYPVAQQIADFGAVQTAVQVRIYQISSTWGRGAPRAATI